jgi:adenylylsulfate kinase
MTEGFTVWFTGLSGAGKSTLATALADELRARGHRVEVLDGDKVRQDLSKGLSYSKEDRDTNVRRIGYVGRLLSRNGVVAIAAAISPYRDIRDEVRRAHEAPFIEVFVACSLEKLIQRDSKGLYARALKGELEHFTGVSDPYEPPLSPDIVVHTDREDVETSLTDILSALERRGLTEQSLRGAQKSV